MKSLSKVLLAFALLVWGLSSVKAQSSPQDDKETKATEVKGLVNNKTFVFEAEKKGNQPLGYHVYSVAVSKDTLIAYLPGQSGPLKFNSTNFGFNVIDTKDGGMDIIIKPGPATDVKQIKMNITSQGTASLYMTRRNAGPLSLDGYIKQEDY